MAGGARLSLAGVSFSVGPGERLSRAERASLAGLGASTTATPSSEEPILIRLEDSAPSWHRRAPATPDPPTVQGAGERVRISHPAMAADIDPAGGEVTLFRDEGPAWPLEVTLRVALASALPRRGGVPLHAAGVAIDGAGLAFFGPSGAGKSTLASLSPFPVLSDEMVAVVASVRGFALAPTGFWGEWEGGSLGRSFPLAAVLELKRGESFSLTRLGAREALPALISATLVPPAPPLWSPTLGVLGRLVREVPVYRMSWRAPEPPWERLREGLDLASR